LYKTTTFQAQPYELKTYFTYAGDLKKDAVVKLSGMQAGRLVSMKHVYDNDKTEVECVLSIDDTAKVRKDSVAYIGTAGFVGDAYIGITVGSQPEFLKPGETIASEEPIQMRELFKKADAIASTLDGTLKEFKTLAVNLNGLVGNVNGVVTDNRGGIERTIKNLEGISVNFKEFSEDVKKHPWKLLFKGE
jgi:phospholipid/cholesterol/gamma-HCH transport system substrate-binding protein